MQIPSRRNSSRSNNRRNRNLGVWGDYPSRAFSLVEILGAVAVTLTLATVSVVSIKDAVSAGQKAAAQRELQTLNTSLQNFLSAGGTIRPGANIVQALEDLQTGIELSGSEFSPLSDSPPMTLSIAGEAYDLTYDPEAGFGYVSASGEGLGLSGQGLTTTGSLGSTGNSINDANVGDYLNQLAMLDSADPEYAALLEQLAVADLINATMLDQGLVYNEETLAWTEVTLTPSYIFDITDPVAVQAALDSLAGLRELSQVSSGLSDPLDPDSSISYTFNENRWDYANTIAALLAAGQQGHAEFSPEVIQSYVDAELTSMMDDVRAEISSFQTTGWSDDPWRWSALMNSLVKVMEVEGYQTGPVADFLFSQLMGMRRNMPADSAQKVDWTVAGITPATLYQPTGANASLTPLLGRAFELKGGDTLPTLFGTPDTTGIVAGTNFTAQRVLVRTPQGNSDTYYWSSSLGRWTRLAFGNADATSTILPPGSTVTLLPL
jgi:type II secretory pathway pseudopilin PulG